MIVVAVVAVLAAIAYPSYMDSVIKGKRAQGRAALMDLLQQQERYMTQTGSYMKFSVDGTGGGTTRSGTGVTIPFKITSGDGSSSAAYKLGAEYCPGGLALNECIQVFAQPTFTDAAAGTLQAQSTGFKSCTGSNTTVCWK